MRNLAVFVLASIVAVSGCGLFKKGDADAGSLADLLADAGAGATTTTAPPITAANSAAVARFATETAVSETRFIASVSTPRTSPKSGTIVATLKVGTEVTRVATNSGDSLITFADPANPTVTLMGWVTDAAFTATIVKKIVDAGVDSGAVAAVVDAGAPAAAADAGGFGTFSCQPGKSAVNLAGKAQCRKSCLQNSDCKNKKPCLAAVSPPQANPPNAPVKACLEEP